MILQFVWLLYVRFVFFSFSDTHNIMPLDMLIGFNAYYSGLNMFSKVVDVIL